MFELLTPNQMNMADQFTIESGTRGIELMDAAGAAVAETAIQEFADIQDILVVCGIGNNGGDGLVAAQKMLDAGKVVHVFVSGDIAKIQGDARLALEKVDKSIIQDSLPELGAYDLIIDALFGAGLDRAVKGGVEELISNINICGKPVLAVDLPSGIDGETGQVMGTAIDAEATCTFFRYKPGHMLMPGRSHCGKLHLAQIGIHPDAIEKVGYAAIRNCPEIWQDEYRSTFQRCRIHAGRTVDRSELTAAIADEIGAEKTSIQDDKGIVLLFDEAFSIKFPEAYRLSSKIEKSRSAASSSKTTIVFGGTDTVVASPDGSVSVFDKSTACLEKSEYKDIFTETAAKLVSQGMTHFNAANAAIWICVKAAAQIGKDLSCNSFRRAINARIDDLTVG